MTKTQKLKLNLDDIKKSIKDFKEQIKKSRKSIRKKNKIMYLLSYIMIFWVSSEITYEYLTMNGFFKYLLIAINLILLAVFIYYVFGYRAKIQQDKKDMNEEIIKELSDG